ncbi:methyl jasmonate esterase 1-like isoform X2 [Quercus robur]|uniref:methyl jasmonate esterase 1-like isoform X2 n=1 Tax=Quercus robur TaxID=38942 RepID=UPI002162E1A7|nr:methyl jasmonate esterase 1-like isoform X2 [Quercus robur]
MEKRERHFVLVHGACHGAWNWYKVVTLLKSAGHKVTALDLAASGIHPKQAHELRSLSDYLEPLMEFMASLPAEERVILVGHSFGGACNSVAMEKFPEKISVAVYATALMPGPDLNFLALNEQKSQRLEDPLKDAQFTFDQGPNNPPTSLLFGYNSMATKLYQLSPPEDFQRWMIENNPADEVKVITGSDHMVMFSKPKELCSCLQEIAEKYS